MSETWQTHWVYPCSDVQNVFILYLSDTYNRYFIFLIIFTRVFDRQVRLYGRTRKAVEETLRICKDQDVLKAYLVRFYPDRQSASY